MDDEIWAGTINGIYVSSDSAVTWFPLPMDTARYVMDLLASGDTILMVGVNTQYINSYSIYSVWRSTDKGATWQKAYDQQQGYGGNVFHESQGVVVLGLGENASISYDFGLTWQNYSLPFIPNYWSTPLFATDSLVVVQWQDAVTDHLSVSRDGFATWQVMDSLPAPTPQSPYYTKIQFLDSVIAIMVKQPAGSGTVFRRSHDYGRTWDTVSTPLQFDYLRHEFGSDTAFAYQGGQAWYSVNHCLTWQMCPYVPNILDYNYWDNTFIKNNILYSSQYQGLQQYQGVIAKNLTTGAITVSDSGILAVPCATLTLSGSRLYVMAKGYIMYSDDGGLTWLPRVSLWDGTCNTPIHVREVPGRPDSLFVWDESKRLLWIDSLQYFIDDDYSSIYSANGRIGNFKNYVIYPNIWRCCSGQNAGIAVFRNKRA